MGAEAAQSQNAGGEKGDDAPKAGGSGGSNKVVKIVTVMAYISGVSGAGFLLSLYYVFFWDPRITGVKPPGYLKSGEMVGLPQARTAGPMAQPLVADIPAGYHKKMSREYMDAYFRNLTGMAGEAGMAADSGMMESQPTPKALPVYPEPNYQHSAYQTQHHDGQTSSQFNNNHQSPGPSPQQGIPRDASSPTGSPFVSDDIRQQQQHGQPPLSASA